MAKLTSRLQLLAFLVLLSVVPGLSTYYNQCYRCDPCHGRDGTDVEGNIQNWAKKECPNGLCMKREGKLTGTRGGYTTSRDCYYRGMTPFDLDIYDECRNISYYDGDVKFKGVLCVCDTELCNDATHWLLSTRTVLICTAFLVFMGIF